MEITQLTSQEELAFQEWVKQVGITDVDHPDSHYDYRGYWKASQGSSVVKGQHFPDTFKQHGHPTFSQESQYSRGLSDGGMWVNDTFVPQPRMAVSHSPIEDYLMRRQ